MTPTASALGVGPDAEIVHPESREALAEALARAQGAGRRVLVAGAGSRLAASGAVSEADVVLTTGALGRIVQYEPADLTVTVEAGCTLAELDRVLAGQGQILPLQPGRARGTVGGLVATAPEGATSLAHGGVRDRLTGLCAALADGTIVKGGGRVVKNVAGYGLHRLMTGSQGTLGAIVEASFKVSPRPERRGSVLFALEESRALGAVQRLLEARLEPVFADVLRDGESSLLAVGFEGMEERVGAHLERVSEIVAPDRPQDRRVLTPEEDESLRRALDDWTNPDARWPGMGEGPVFAAWRRSARTPVRAVLRLADLPAKAARTAELARLAATGGDAHAALDVRPAVGSAFLMIEADGAGEAASAVRRALESARGSGSAILLAAPREVAREVDRWGPAPPDFFLMKKIKQALDPGGAFAAGGFVGGL